MRRGNSNARAAAAALCPPCLMRPHVHAAHCGWTSIDLARATGTWQASIYNPCHESPDTEELESASAAQLPPDTEELDGAAFVGASRWPNLHAFHFHTPGGGVKDPSRQLVVRMWVGFETPAGFDCTNRPFREASVKGLESRRLSPTSISRGGQVGCRHMPSKCSGVISLAEKGPPPFILKGAKFDADLSSQVRVPVEPSPPYTSFVHPSLALRICARHRT